MRSFDAEDDIAICSTPSPPLDNAYEVYLPLPPLLSSYLKSDV
jgi:hypothetical protein